MTSGTGTTIATTGTVHLEVRQPNFSASAGASLARCPRKWFLGERMRLTTPWLSEALVTGQLVHLELAARFRGFNDGQTREVMKSAQTQLENSLSERDDEPARAQLDEVQQWVALARVTADHFWTTTVVKPDNGYTVVASEREYTMEHEVVRGLPIKGVVDLVIRDAGGNHYIWDFKTTGDSPKDWPLAHPTNWQAKVYSYLTQRDTTLDPRPRGIIYAVIRKPSIRWKAWQTFEDYLAECRDWYRGTKGTCPSNPAKHWDHTGNADKWQSDPTISYHPVLFGATDLTDREAVNMLLHYENYRQATPTLANFPRLGELSNQCKSRVYGSCEFLGLCREDADWDREVARLVRREDMPILGDPEDHLWDNLPTTPNQGAPNHAH